MFGIVMPRTTTVAWFVTRATQPVYFVRAATDRGMHENGNSSQKAHKMNHGSESGREETSQFQD